MRAPRMWSLAGDPRASLGRRGAHGDGLMVVFWALSVAAVESLRNDLRGTVGTEVIPRVSSWHPMRAHACPTHVGSGRGTLCLFG